MTIESKSILMPALVAALTAVAAAGDLQFADMTVPAEVDVTHSASGYSHSNYTAGGAVGDFNNDGLQDLFVISGGGGSAPDHLFINNGDGTFDDQAAAWGVATPHKGKGASVGDINDDGWLDLYVTSAGPASGAAPGHHKLYRNNGNGTFTNIATSAGVNTTTTSVEDGFGSTFGDIDLDGDLDLFVAGFLDAGNRLFRNNGNETFTDVTTESGIATISLSSCFAPRLIDTDGDRYPDLLLVADFGNGHYIRNDGDGTFTDWTGPSGADQEENGMGQTVGDFNRDGMVDWYITSIFFPSIGWTGNKLYLNTGNHTFDEVSQSVGVDDGGYGWGALAVDFNHDGLLDIAETNGDSTDSGSFGNEQSYLWMQNQSGNFTETALAMGFEHFGRGRGLVNLDYDNDGDQDIALFAYNQRMYFFENQLSGADINWLRIFLDTSRSPNLAPGGHGAIVSITVDGSTQTEAITSGDNFLSHSELSAHFGVGAATLIDELRVDWPDGTSTVMNDVAPNQTMTIVSGAEPVPGDADGDGLVSLNDLLILLGTWGPCPDCPPSCAADFDGDCNVSVSDLLIVLQFWN